MLETRASLRAGVGEEEMVRGAPPQMRELH